MHPSTPVPRAVCELHAATDHCFGLPAAMCDRLSASTVWVTGAGTGFGRAVATALALLGSRVLLTGRRVAKLEETASDIARLGGSSARVDVLPFDLTDRHQVEAAAGTLRDAGVMGLVHCAAIPQSRDRESPLVETDSLTQLLTANVIAAWHAARACVAVAATKGIVRVVLYTSEAAWHFTPGFGPYNISKAALNSLGACLAEEVAPRHVDCDVQINVLNPGEARTEMNQGSLVSPLVAVPMTLALVGQPAGGPNGYFFHADGRHLAFGSRPPWPASLIGPERSARSAIANG